jgi:16S rRNA (guanine966-N2)-methyltransferase
MEALGDRLDGARVLDLFAGTGALGLEALSRGAARADFVDNGRQAIHSLKANVAAFRLRKRARVFTVDAIPFAERLEEDAYDVAFADPPYGSAKLDRVLAAWKETRFARVLGVEHAADHPFPRGLPRPGRRLRFGDTTVTLFGLGGR